MAKYISSGLIPFIKGPLGDVVFTYWRGIPVIRKRKKKMKGTRTPAQRKASENLVLISSTWKNLSFKEWALWGSYTKRYTKMKTRERDGLCMKIGGKMTGCNAYVSLNQLLILSGLNSIRVPPLGKIGKPPLPSADLIDHSVYENEIKFNIWLPRPYPTECVAQIWISKAVVSGYPYRACVVKVSTSKTEVTIDKIRMRRRKDSKQRGEKKFKNMENCKVYLQLRTIAQNGEFSMPSQIYKLEVKSTNFKNRKTRQEILKVFPQKLKAFFS